MNRSGSAVSSFSEFHSYKTSYIILFSTRIFFVSMWIPSISSRNTDKTISSHCKSLATAVWLVLLRYLPWAFRSGHGYADQRLKTCATSQGSSQGLASSLANSSFIQNIPLLGCFFLLSVSLLWSNTSPPFLPSHCNDAAFVPGQITEAFPPPRSIHASQRRVYPRLPIA